MLCSTKRIGTFAILISLPLCCVIPIAALAQQSSSTSVTSTTTMDSGVLPRAPEVWDISLGGGAALRPTYQGSNRYEAAPVLFFNVTYRDMISLGAGGLSAYWHNDDLKIGIGLTQSGGRRDHQTNGLFETGDDRLKGLGDINPALSIRGFATYRLGFIVLDGAVTKLTNHFDNHGVFANAGVSAPQKLSDRLILTPHVITTWANRNYTETFFGVTAAQAADSAFPEFNAGAGFMNVAAGVAAAYLVNPHWFFRASADVTKLTGDAGDSPITFSSTNALVSIITGYRF
jgi:outer membrane protein